MRIRCGKSRGQISTDAGEDVREEAARLAEELPSLMPGDPAMAAVIEEAMAEEFAETVAEGKAKGEGEGAVKNSTDANGADDEKLRNSEEEYDYRRLSDEEASTLCDEILGGGND